MYRRRVSSSLTILLIIFSCACTTQEPAAVVASPEEAKQLAASATVVNVAPPSPAADETVCRKEYVTGSHRPRTVCQTRSQQSATRAAAQDWYRSGGRTGEISQVPVVR